MGGFAGNFGICDRPPEVEVLEDAVVRYFVMQCGIPEEEVGPLVRGSFVVCADLVGTSILGFVEGEGRPICPLGFGIAKTEEMAPALGQLIRGARLASVSSYICSDGEVGTPLKWRGWRSREADRAFVFFAGQAASLSLWEKGEDIKVEGISRVEDASLAACMRIFYPSASGPEAGFIEITVP